MPDTRCCTGLVCATRCVQQRKKEEREMERKWQGWGRGGVGGRRGRREGWRRGGARAAVFWPLSRGSVASSQQTKHWSQLNITFPFVPSERSTWGGPPDLRGASWSTTWSRDRGLLPLFLTFWAFFFYVPLLATRRHLSVLCWNEELASPVPLLVCHAWQTAKMTPTRPLNLKPPFSFSPFIRSPPPNIGF